MILNFQDCDRVADDSTPQYAYDVTGPQFVRPSRGFFWKGDLCYDASMTARLSKDLAAPIDSRQVHQPCRNEAIVLYSATHLIGSRFLAGEDRRSSRRRLMTAGNCARPRLANRYRKKRRQSQNQLGPTCVWCECWAESPVVPEALAWLITPGKRRETSDADSTVQN